jgi:hypothetical protein
MKRQILKAFYHNTLECTCCWEGAVQEWGYENKIKLVKHPAGEVE